MRDKPRCALCLLLCAVIALMSGCSQNRIASDTEAIRPRITATPAPTLDNEPAKLYSSVLTEERVISLILEGYTDDETMRPVIDALKKAKVPCVFFLSGIAANEHPDVVREIADAGFTIGNYGISGAKKMEENDIPTNIHLFQRGQELLTETTGVTPELFRCNGSEYTDDVLKAASYVGLKAGVKPNVYLNHSSFKEKTAAENYVQKLLPGSIVSIKLGQALDASEFDGIDEIMSKLAVDPEPFLSDNMDEVITSTYENIVNVVSWLIEALVADGYTIISPEALQQKRITAFDQPLELDDETLSAVNYANYELPLTSAPLGIAESALADVSVLSGSVFVGDSITEGLSDYVNWQRETKPEYLSGVQFLTSPNLGIITSQMRVSATSVHPVVNGVRMTVADALSRLEAKKVFLMPGLADYKASNPDKIIDNLKLMIYRIRSKNQGIKIYLQSVPPGVLERTQEPSNAKIFQCNLAIYKFCRQYSIPFIDVAFAMRDEKGNLQSNLCIDADTYGYHLNDAGCEKWLKYILTHTSDGSQPSASASASPAETTEPENGVSTDAQS